MPEPSEEAIEAKEKDRTIALIIAILALLLALAEAGAKNAQHLSTEKNIEASDLFNFYQAKKIRQTVVEAATQTLEAEKGALGGEATQATIDKQIEAFKAQSGRFENDPKKPEDNLEAIQKRAEAANEARELANHRLEHYELGSGLAQIAIVLASAAIITGIVALTWCSVGLGVLSAVLLAFGFLAPTVLPFMG